METRTQQKKIDGRTKAGRALKSQPGQSPQADRPNAPPPPPTNTTNGTEVTNGNAAPAEEVTDPHLKDWTDGFNLVKDGQALPATASDAMQEGGRAAQQQALIIQQAQANLSKPPRNPYGGYTVEFNVGEDEHKPPGEEWDFPQRQQQPPAPRRQMPLPEPVVLQEPPQRHSVPVAAAALPGNAHHIRRAQDVIRAAQERAAAETKAASEFLQFTMSKTKRDAFIAFCEGMKEVPPAPPMGPYGEKDEAYMCYLADWKPDEFLTKFAKCSAPLANDLRREIQMR